MRFLSYCILAIFLGGCFSLKTSLPPVSYYDLDIDLPLSSKCQNSLRIGIAKIASSFIYDNREILYRKSNAEMISLSGMGWIDLPKNLIKQILIKQFEGHCIQASLPPLSGIKNDLILKVELFNFLVEQEQNQDEFVHIGLFYELLDVQDSKVVKSGMISLKEKVEQNYILSFKKAMQKIGQQLIQLIKSNSLTNKNY